MNNLIKYKAGTALLDPDVCAQIIELERALKALKQQSDDLKQAILDEMERKNILKIDTDDLTITYIASTDKATFDSKTFKKDHADLYDEYVKLTAVKSSIRIKVK